MNKHFIRFRFLSILIMLAVIAAFSVAVMVLWNVLVTDIFGLPELNYWQAAGILVLVRILFGGIGKGRLIPGGMERGGRDFHHGNKLREKWMNMTEEERKAFVEKENGFRDFFNDRFSRDGDPRGDFRGGFPYGEKPETKKDGSNE
jgi:hypothetical protein